eukprot:TRINITY_DN2207_c0_g1_i1.p1 TRINITY_DN2207_c0_g1~~TRINITY_DN2207_c0_g1_i1.p1  ORF type:complete len:1096 (+),score=147.53 TRINITY_DN2207_c0_g1_i1:637-3924(+)
MLKICSPAHQIMGISSRPMSGAMIGSLGNNGKKQKMYSILNSPNTEVKFEEFDQNLVNDVESVVNSEDEEKASISSNEKNKPVELLPEQGSERVSYYCNPPPQQKHSRIESNKGFFNETAEAINFARNEVKKVRCITPKPKKEAKVQYKVIVENVKKDEQRLRRCASWDSFVKLRLIKKVSTERRRVDLINNNNTRRNQKLLDPKKPTYTTTLQSTHKAKAKPVPALGKYRFPHKEKSSGNKTSVLTQKMLHALNSATFTQDPMDIKINPEFYSRIKIREIFKQIQYNFRYESDKSFDADPSSCFCFSKAILNIKRDQYYNFPSPNLCTHPYIYKAVLLMLRQLYTLEKVENYATIAKLRKSEVKQGLEYCFESAQEFLELKTQMQQQTYEENERKKMTEDIKTMWYKVIHRITLTELFDRKAAAIIFVYGGKKYSHNKLCKTNCKELEYVDLKKKKRKRRGSCKNALFPLYAELAFEKKVELAPVSDSDSEDYAVAETLKTKFTLSEVTAYAKSLKETIGEAVKCGTDDIFESFPRQKSGALGKFDLKMPAENKRCTVFGTKEILFNIKEAKLDLPVPEEPELDHGQSEGLRKMFTYKTSTYLEKSEDLSSLISLFGADPTPEILISHDTDEQEQLLHKVNMEFREEFVKRMDNYEVFTQNQEYSGGVGEMVLRWQSLHQALQTVEADSFKPENRAFVVDIEKVSSPYIFTGSERLKGESLLERWLPQHKMSDANTSIDTLSDFSDGMYIPLKRENEITKKEDLSKFHPRASKLDEEKEEEESKALLLPLHDPLKWKSFKEQIESIRGHYKKPKTGTRELPRAETAEVLGLQRRAALHADIVTSPLTPELHEAIVHEEEIPLEEANNEVSSCENSDLKPKDSPTICISPIQNESEDEEEKDITPMHENSTFLCLSVFNKLNNKGPGMESKRGKVRDLRIELKDMLPTAEIEIPSRTKKDSREGGGTTLPHRLAVKIGEQAQAQTKLMTRRKSEKSLISVDKIKPMAETKEEKKEKRRKKFLKNMTGTIHLNAIKEEGQTTDRQSFRRRRIYLASKGPKLVMNNPAQLLYNAIRRMQVNDVPLPPPLIQNRWKLY